LVAANWTGINEGNPGQPLAYFAGKRSHCMDRPVRPCRPPSSPLRSPHGR
jgi:hypothetical protein